ncbi:MAG: DUF4845 domain-containing protein, partial [Gammaproteobacteria bacterium]|nr:DUF4845 domain-containing protein [Gammaproteobacteria bacterium]
RSLNRQRGITFWGFLMVSILVGFYLFLFFKLLSPYLEYGKVKTSLENVARQPDAGNMERTEIMAALERRFAIEDINRVDLKKSLIIEKKPGVTNMRITYEVRVPLFYQVSALLDFDASAQAKSR